MLSALPLFNLLPLIKILFSINISGTKFELKLIKILCSTGIVSQKAFTVSMTEFQTMVICYSFDHIENNCNLLEYYWIINAVISAWKAFLRVRITRFMDLVSKVLLCNKLHGKFSF